MCTRVRTHTYDAGCTDISLCRHNTGSVLCCYWCLHFCFSMITVLFGELNVPDLHSSSVWLKSNLNPDRQLLLRELGSLFSIINDPKTNIFLFLILHGSISSFQYRVWLYLVCLIALKNKTGWLWKNYGPLFINVSIILSPGILTAD